LIANAIRFAAGAVLGIWKTSDAYNDKTNLRNT